MTEMIVSLGSLAHFSQIWEESVAFAFWNSIHYDISLKQNVFVLNNSLFCYQNIVDITYSSIVDFI